MAYMRSYHDVAEGKPIDLLDLIPSLMAAAAAAAAAEEEEEEAAKEAASTPAVEPLTYQTRALKVSLHCEGCKRKVKKVLQTIDGVCTVSVDLPQHKVTVTGNVDVDVLLRKLHKAGRHAEPWPEKPTKKEKADNKESGKDEGRKDTKGKGGGKHPTAAEARHFQAEGTDDVPSAKAAASAEKTAAAPRGAVRESTKASEGKDAAGPHPVSGGGPTDSQKAGGGGGGKKGKKGKKEGGEGPEVSSDAGANLCLPSPHHPPPVYIVSYGTVHPGPSGGAAYHAVAPLALPQQSHLHGPQQRRQYTGYYCQLPPAGVFIPPAPAEEEGSYDVFSDENAHACCVM